VKTEYCPCGRPPIANCPLLFAVVANDCCPLFAATSRAPPSGLPPAFAVPVIAAPRHIVTALVVMSLARTVTWTSVGAYFVTS